MRKSTQAHPFRIRTEKVEMEEADDMPLRWLETVGEFSFKWIMTKNYAVADCYSVISR